MKHLMKSNWFSFGVILMLCLISHAAVAQSKLSITAPDSLAFTLFLDGTQMNNQAFSQLSIFEVGAGKHELKIKVAKLEGVFSMTAKKFVHHQFQLAFSNNLLQLLPVGESKLQAGQFQIISSEPSPEKIYGGLKGCEQALSLIDFETEVEKLKAMPFDSQRKQALKDLCRDKCLSADQVVSCLKLLELEENRLDAMIDVVSRIFDVENARQMLDLLYLDGNKILLDKHITQIKQNSVNQP
jgi:hypothetical protein